ncbi:MAG: DUF3592 domain-containing protein [Janthinobacterium lividum]
MDWIFVLIFVVGALGLTFGLYLVHLQRERLEATGGRVKGVVVRNKLHLGRNTVMYSVVRFTTVEGVVVEAEHSNTIATALPGYSMGDEVQVAYDKANPSDFIIL